MIATVLVHNKPKANKQILKSNIFWSWGKPPQPPKSFLSGFKISSF